MNRTPTARRGGVLLVLAFVSLLGTSCRKKVNRQQCDEMLDRFIDLVAKEQMPDASAEKKAQTRAEAKADVAFKNCTSEVQPEEFACAMKAEASEAMLKCLE
jgi:hypothetical protein